jgi:helicase required for RNAi-mediated heterochromatin assembly 1
VLLRMLRAEPALRFFPTFNVFTVDSYQGEENDIIILSLVRSPKRDMPYMVGFLEDKNRATVAISRARRGFYVFGNFSNMLRANEESFEVWGRVHHCFAMTGCFDTIRGLPVVCQQHQTELWVRVADDFVGNAGGCWQKRMGCLPCGHECKLMCHW